MYIIQQWCCNVVHYISSILFVDLITGHLYLLTIFLQFLLLLPSASSTTALISLSLRVLFWIPQKSELIQYFSVWHMVAQTVKNLPTTLETWVLSLGWEDPLKVEMATHSSILAWRIPQTEEPSVLQLMGSQRIGHDWATNTISFFFFSPPGSFFCFILFFLFLNFKILY